MAARPSDSTNLMRITPLVRDFWRDPSTGPSATRRGGTVSGITKEVTMGFFDKMKASVGIGGAKIELAVPDSPALKGGTLQGTVILTGGKIAQRCNGITVTLRVTRMVSQSGEGASS